MEPYDAAEVIASRDRNNLYLTSCYFRDPERFWRIADANTAMWPDDLVREPNERILIPSSEE